MTVFSRAKRFQSLLSRLTTYAAVGLFGPLLLPACTDDYLTDGVVTITTGQELDAWTAEPIAQKVLLEMVQTSGRTSLAYVPAPVSSISIGTEGPSNSIAAFETTAFAADGNVVMRGSSVPLGIVGFEGANIGMFMGRLGGFSRPPGDLIFPRRHPRLEVLYHGYLLIAGGDEPDANLDVYDMALWRAAPEQKPLPKVPESWAIANPKLLLIDHGGAIWLDMSTYKTSDVDAPPGLAFADVVGGETISGPDDTRYIVGATRTTGAPTNAVLRVDPDATLHLMKLATARLGASAAIVDGRLLVVGGADSGAGAELWGESGVSFAALPFPSDATQGAALVARDATTVMLAGGRVPESDEIVGFRSMDLSCAKNCAQVPIEDADFAFDRPRLFPLNAAELLATGDDPATGETHVFTFELDGHALKESALRTPRRGASTALLPNGQLGVLGGDALAEETPATSVELFFPPQ